MFKKNNFKKLKKKIEKKTNNPEILMFLDIISKVEEIKTKVDNTKKSNVEDLKALEEISRDLKNLNKVVIKFNNDLPNMKIPLELRLDIQKHIEFLLSYTGSYKKLDEYIKTIKNG